MQTGSQGGQGDDILVGGDGFDTFVFADASGRDVISDFSEHNSERIDLSSVAEIVDFADLIANHLVDVGGTAVITYGGVNTIELTNWTLADIGVGEIISASDFIF